jgi:hypothetical protein
MTKHDIGTAVIIETRNGNVHTPIITIIDPNGKEVVRSEAMESRESNRHYFIYTPKKDATTGQYTCIIETERTQDVKRFELVGYSKKPKKNREEDMGFIL